MDGTAYRTSSDLIGLAVIVLIIGGLSVAAHGHDVGEHGAWAVVLVCVEEETEALELVRVAEDVAWLGALLGEPHGKTVTVEVALAGDFELEYNLLA